MIGDFIPHGRRISYLGPIARFDFRDRLHRLTIYTLFKVTSEWALNMLKRESTSEVGVRAKRKRAGWDPDYLMTVLNS